MSNKLRHDADVLLKNLCRDSHTQDTKSSFGTGYMRCLITEATHKQSSMHAQSEFPFLTAFDEAPEGSCASNCSRDYSLAEETRSIIAPSVLKLHPTVVSFILKGACAANDSKSTNDVFEPIRPLTDRSPPTRFQRRFQRGAGGSIVRIPIQSCLF